MKKIALIAAGLAAVFALCLLAGTLSPKAADAAAADKTQAANPALVTAQGMGEVTVKPDQTTIVLGVQHEDKDAKKAQAAVTTAMNNLIEAMKKAGVKEADMQTSYYNISPNYDWSSSKQRLTGYTVSHSLNLRIDGTDVGALIDAATAAGANQIQSINFGLKDQTLSYHKALENAVADAKARADVLAKATGKSVDAIMSINEGGVATQYPYSEAYRGASNFAGVMDATQIISGDMKVSASVTITYTLK